MCYITWIKYVLIQIISNPKILQVINGWIFSSIYDAQEKAGRLLYNDRLGYFKIKYHCWQWVLTLCHQWNIFVVVFQ